MAGASACASDDEPDSAVVDPRGAAVTEFAGLEPASGDVTLPGIDTASPDPGSVVRVAGPFDDRFGYDALRLRRGVVTGQLTVSTDVSDLLELELVAGFYDARGELLGTARWVHHLEDGEGHTRAGPPEESEYFRVAAPRRLRDRVASAAVGVPVLVNE